MGICIIITIIYVGVYTYIYVDVYIYVDYPVKSITYTNYEAYHKVRTALLFRP